MSLTNPFQQALQLYGGGGGGGTGGVGAQGPQGIIGSGFQGLQGLVGSAGAAGVQGVQGLVGPTGGGGGGAQFLTKMAMATGTTGFIDLQLDAPLKQGTIVYRNKGLFGNFTLLQVGNSSTTYASNYVNATGNNPSGFDTNQQISNFGSTGTAMITNYPLLNSIIMNPCCFAGVNTNQNVSGIVDVPNSSTIDRIRMIPSSGGTYDTGAFITAVYLT